MTTLGRPRPACAGIGPGLHVRRQCAARLGVGVPGLLFARPGDLLAYCIGNSTKLRSGVFLFELVMSWSKT